MPFCLAIVVKVSLCAPGSNGAGSGLADVFSLGTGVAVCVGIGLGPSLGAVATEQVKLEQLVV